MNEYLYELSNYIKEVPEVKEVPRGIYSVTDGEKKGVIFCFKHKNVFEKPKNESSLYPYYLLYISNSKEIYFSNVQAREVLKDFRKLCYRKDEPNKELFEIFRLYDNLIRAAYIHMSVKLYGADLNNLTAQTRSNSALNGKSFFGIRLIPFKVKSYIIHLFFLLPLLIFNTIIIPPVPLLVNIRYNHFIYFLTF